MRAVLPPKSVIPLSYAARTTTGSPYTTSEVVNALGYSQAIFYLFADNELNTSTLDCKIQAYDELSAKWYDIPGASYAQVSANMTVPVDLVIGVGLTAVANRVVSQPVPKRMRAIVTIAGASGGFSVSLGCDLLP